ncbi:MAG: Rne/Rng family ribonuclease [Actinobacteria bacterium]|nr:Rne/Rng family ribonuclease [Actinomycetota bacterium]
MSETPEHLDRPVLPVVGETPTSPEATTTESSTSTPDSSATDSSSTDSSSPAANNPARKKRRRGSRGGRNRPRPNGGVNGTTDASSDAADDEFGDDDEFDDDGHDDGSDDGDDASSPASPGAGANPVELPERMSEGRPSPDVAAQAVVQRPKIGDTRPAPPSSGPAVTMPGGTRAGQAAPGRGKQNKGAKPNPKPAVPATDSGASPDGSAGGSSEGGARKKRRRNGRGRGTGSDDRGAGRSTDADVVERRRGRERNGRPIGRHFMCVQVRPNLTQVAVLEGRSLIEHYVSRPADDVAQIHGNIYVGKVQNVLPGMEAAFVDIGTPKNAVLYRGDVQYDAEDIVDSQPRIEQILKGKQLIVCQVTKNPIGVKGARLTQEVSLPGRFVVLIPNSKTYGISKRLPDAERKRLRSILDRVKPAEHGLIVRTAAETATEHELRADMTRLVEQWNDIEAKAKKANGPTLLYREPPLAVRVIREEFNSDYRGVVIDDRQLYEDVRDYVQAFNPELADRVEYFDATSEGLPIFEKHHVHEQIHKALDRKVWLPSGGSLIIEHTEALTVIDVNTGRNVGTSNLEATVFQNNLEAAEEVAHQLRLRDIGGIIVIDFIDMEIKENRKKVVEAFRSALSRDKTRTQVFDISELGLVEMTRKRIGEGLLTSFAGQCPDCQGRGVLVDHDLLH